MDPVWDRVDQCRPRGPRRYVADKFYSLRAALPDHAEWTGVTAGPHRALLGPAARVRYPTRENEALGESVLGKRLLLQGVDRMKTYAGSAMTTWRST
eukprot:4855407-Pyramimonas_sp.AAC.1